MSVIHHSDEVSQTGKVFWTEVDRDTGERAVSPLEVMSVFPWVLS